MEISVSSPLCSCLVFMQLRLHTLSGADVGWLEPGARYRCSAWLYKHTQVCAGPPRLPRPHNQHFFNTTPPWSTTARQVGCWQTKVGPMVVSGWNGCSGYTPDAARLHLNIPRYQPPLTGGSACLLHYTNTSHSRQFEQLVCCTVCDV